MSELRDRAYLQHAPVGRLDQLGVRLHKWLAMCAGVNALSPVAVLHGLADHAAFLDGNHLLPHKLLTSSDLAWPTQAVENDVASIIALKIGHLLEITIDSEFDWPGCKKIH